MVAATTTGVACAVFSVAFAWSPWSTQTNMDVNLVFLLFKGGPEYSKVVPSLSSLLAVISKLYLLRPVVLLQFPV